MNRIVRFIIMCAALTIVVGASGCNIFGPKAEEVWYTGKVTNPSDRTLKVALANPDPEHGLGTKDDYTRQVTLADGGGSATYWLHERGRSNPYVFHIFDIDGKLVRKINVSPDGQANDHGSWSWTVNAATGSVQFSIKGPGGSSISVMFDANGNYVKTVRVD